MALTETYTNASRSMAAAASMRPQLQSIARVITGNPKLNILFDGKGSRTDTKNTIWLTPPGDLGKFRTHMRAECSKYDDLGFSWCQACREEEAFFATALHECAHIAYGSGDAVLTTQADEIQKLWLRSKALKEFENRLPHDTTGFMVHMSEAEKEKWLTDWINSDGFNLWRKFADRYQIRDSYMAAASLTSPWLPGLLNAIEDSRVNRMLHSHRPGTTRMFEASTRAIMEDGIIDLDGQPIHWKDRDVDQQVLLAALLISSKFSFDYASCLVPEATEVYEDPLLRSTMRRIDDAEDIHTMYLIAKDILERLQELGYCEDPPEEDGEGPGPGGEDGEEGESPIGGSGRAHYSSDESGDGDDGEGEGRESDRTKAAREGHALVLILGGHAGDVDKEVNDLRDDGEPVKVEELGEPSEEAPKWDRNDPDMEVASIHFEHFDSPPTGIAKVREYRFDGSYDPSEGGGSFDRIWGNYQSGGGSYHLHDVDDVKWAAHQHLPIMRKIFSENRAVKTTRHLKAGRIDSAALGRKLKTGRVDVFRKREQPDTRSYAVCIGLDISGSTATGVLDPMKAAAFAQAEMLAKANIPFEFNCHTGASDYTSYRGVNLEIIKIKDWDEKWGPDHLKRLNAVRPAACNLDGHTFEYYRKSVAKRREDVGLVLYFTDGAMPAENYHEELTVLKREVEHIKRQKNLEMLAIGVGNTEPEEYGLEMVRYDSLADLPALLKALERKLTRR